MGLAFIQYGREEAADDWIQTMTADQDPIIRCSAALASCLPCLRCADVHSSAQCRSDILISRSGLPQRHTRYLLLPAQPCDRLSVHA